MGGIAIRTSTAARAQSQTLAGRQQTQYSARLQHCYALLCPPRAICNLQGPQEQSEYHRPAVRSQRGRGRQQISNAAVAVPVRSPPAGGRRRSEWAILAPHHQHADLWYCGKPRDAPVPAHVPAQPVAPHKVSPPRPEAHKVAPLDPPPHEVAPHKVAPPARLPRSDSAPHKVAPLGRRLTQGPTDFKLLITESDLVSGAGDLVRWRRDLVTGWRDGVLHRNSVEF